MSIGAICASIEGKEQAQELFDRIDKIYRIRRTGQREGPSLLLFILKGSTTEAMEGHREERSIEPQIAPMDADEGKSKSKDFSTGLTRFTG